MSKDPRISELGSGINAGDWNGAVERGIRTGAQLQDRIKVSTDRQAGCLTGNAAELKGSPEKYGSAREVIASFLKENNTGVICVGLKEGGAAMASPQTGRVVLCQSEADVLFLPEPGTQPPERILVPVDLSARAADLVERIIRRFPGSEIHIYFVNYIPSPVVMEESDRKRLIEASSRNLETGMQHFIDNLKTEQKDVSYHYDMSEHFNAGYSIHEHALDNQYDLIAIGRLSKLDKGLPFLGSVTDKLLSLCNNIPVLVVNH